MRKLIILAAAVAPVALFAGGVIGQTALPPESGASPSTGGAAGGQLTGAPQGGNTAQGNSQLPPGAGRSAQETQRNQERTQGQNAQRTDPTPKAGTADSGNTTTRNKSTQTTNNTTNTTNNTNVNITSEKRTTIKQTITSTDVEPVRDVNFSVNVGVAIPHSVELHPLPPRVVEIVPQYRSYRYFVMADGRIIIVEPDSYKIVYVIA